MVKHGEPFAANKLQVVQHVLLGCSGRCVCHNDRQSALVDLLAVATHDEQEVGTEGSHDPCGTHESCEWQQDAVRRQKGSGKVEVGSESEIVHQVFERRADLSQVRHWTQSNEAIY